MEEKEYIDANSNFVLKDGEYTLDFSYGYINIYHPDGTMLCQFDIDDIPKTNPTLRAKWIPIVNISNPKEDMEKIGSKCSNCGGHGYYTDRYCKHCGALMED